MRRRACRRTKNLLALGVLAAYGCGGRPSPSGPVLECGGGKIWHPEELARVQGCRHISGDLHLGGALTDAKELEGLTSIEGDLIVGPSYQLNNLASLGSVVRIGGDLRLERNWRLQGLYMGALEFVGGDIRVEGNVGLVACVLPKLRSVSALEVGNNRNLERLDLSGLDEEGPDLVVRGRKLRSVMAPARGLCRY